MGAQLSISKFASVAGTLQSISHCLLYIKPASTQDLVPIFDFSLILNKFNATAYLKTCKQYQQKEKIIFILSLFFSYVYPRQSWHYRGKDIWHNFYGLISLNRNRDIGLGMLRRWRRVVFWEVLAQTDHSKIHNKNFFKPQKKNKPITDM